jgi:imidazolonepropionase-like amidohydrolase
MRGPSTRRVLLAVLLLLPVAACRPASDLLAIVNGTLVDGTGAAPVAGAVLVVRQGRITAVGPRAVVDIPAGAQVVDAGGGTILPGFINAHVHQGFDEVRLGQGRSHDRARPGHGLRGLPWHL